MSYLTEQIELEKKKIELLKEAIDNCYKRISKLESLDKGDKLDAFVSSMIRTNSQAIVNEKSIIGEIEPIRSPGKRIADKTKAILKFFGSEGRYIKDAVDYSNANNIGLNENSIRNLAMTYRKDFGYLESTGRGFYRLTELGQEAVK